MITGPYFVFQEKHEKEFLCPYELALFKMILFQSLDGFGDGDGPDPASAGGRGGRARSTLQRALVGLGRRT